MGTTQPLILIVDGSISKDTQDRWIAAGNRVFDLIPVLDHEGFEIHYDGIVSERAWRANDEMLKSTEGMMFKAMRAEKRARNPKPAKKPRKPRKKVEVMP